MESWGRTTPVHSPKAIWGIQTSPANLLDRLIKVPVIGSCGIIPVTPRFARQSKIGRWTMQLCMYDHDELVFLPQS